MTEAKQATREGYFRHMKIMKFGGTSVGSPARMQHVADLVASVDGPRVVVLSAVAGTTNALVEIGELAKDRNMSFARESIDRLKSKYVPFVHELYQTEEVRQSAIGRIDVFFKTLVDLIDTPFNIVRDKEILSLGELISTRLFELLLKERSEDAVWLNALEFMLAVDGEPDLDEIKQRLAVSIGTAGTHDIYLTQGFICRNGHGEVDNLRRGGSDYTASILGAVLDAREIQIWTDIDGIHNNDPRVVKTTRPIQQLSFDEAAEMAYFGAKVLHPSTVHPAKLKNIPVRLLNTMEPDAHGTVICSRTGSTESKAKAVAAKDGITAINIRSHRMLMAHGFLRKVFEIFERYSTPIDMITTSEVAVSLTIDDPMHLKAITRDLAEFGQVSIDREQTIICVVGEFAKEDVGVGVRILECLRHIPIRMISSGGSESNISLLIDSKYKTEALESLNAHLFGL